MTRKTNPQPEHDENRFVAEKLTEVADLLEQQQASSFRVNAYRTAAQFVDAYDEPIRAIYAQDGERGLDALPTIGRSIAAAIAELLDTGQLALIARLRGQADPEQLFQTVPMVGPKLAQMLHDALDLETLEDLEAAAHDGRLATVRGIGPRRLRTLQHSLAEMLARKRPRMAQRPDKMPSLRTILDIDRDYRSKAQAGVLPQITPRRFNPTGQTRLPILHTECGPWHFTALYSNTPNAHKYNKTRDWVVIYYAHNGGAEAQCTVITAQSGPMKGARVVRGFEAASAAVHARWMSRKAPNRTGPK